MAQQPTTNDQRPATNNRGHNNQIVDGQGGDRINDGNGEPLHRRQMAVDTLIAGGGRQAADDTTRAADKNNNQTVDGREGGGDRTTTTTEDG